MQAKEEKEEGWKEEVKSEISSWWEDVKIQFKLM